MREYIKLPLILFIVATVAGLVLGITNSLTKEPIRQQHEMALRNAREELFDRSVFVEIDDLSMLDDAENVRAVFKAKENDVHIGYIVTLTQTGYGGDILMNVGVTLDGYITGVVVGTNSETPGLGAKASEHDFTQQFVGKPKITLVKRATENDDEVSAITAATITSQAIVDGAMQAVEISAMMGGAS